MWDKILTMEAISFLIQVSDETEDDESIGQFILFLKKNIDYKVVVMMATQWAGYDDEKQANLAIHTVGIHHASRLIMLMDYLALKYEEGKLV